MGLLGHFVRFLVLIGFTACLEGAEVRRPNILFILTDDLGYMDIGANNPKTFYETPNIDRGWPSRHALTRDYAACPVCSPTTAASVLKTLRNDVHAVMPTPAR